MTEQNRNWLSVSDELTIIIGKLIRFQLDHDLPAEARAEIQNTQRYVERYREHVAGSGQPSQQEQPE